MFEAGSDLEPREILLGDEIDHTGNGVRAIGRGSAVFEHFQAANRGRWDGVGIDNTGAGLAKRIDGQAATIHQDQGTL